MDYEIMKKMKCWGVVKDRRKLAISWAYDLHFLFRKMLDEAKK
jgi:hypothetical protein